MMTGKASHMLFLTAFLSGLALAPARVSVAHIQETTGGAVDVDTSERVGRDLLASRARCIAYAFTSQAKKDEAFAKSVADVAAYVCGDSQESEASAEVIAEATATAYAVAVTEASVVCEGEGQTEIYARAYAKANETAQVWLKAYAEATAVAGDCEKCSVFSNSFGFVEKSVFLQAVSESEAIIEGYRNASSARSLREAGKKFVAEVKKVNVNIQEASATAFAKAIAGARKYREENECFAWVGPRGCIVTPETGECDDIFNCEGLSVSGTRIKEVNALADAGAAAIAFTCATNDTSEAEAFTEVEVAAEEVAMVMAEAISYTFAQCDNSGDGAYACVSSSGAAEAMAKAVAEAFAEAWASGNTCQETCTVDVETAVSSIEELLVTASTSAFSQLCTDKEGKWTVEALAQSIASDSKTAIAQAIAETVIISNDGQEECEALAIAEAYIE